LIGLYFSLAFLFGEFPGDAMLFYMVYLLVVFGLYFHLSCLFKSLPPEFRQLDPDLVWFLLIPGGGMIWDFVVFPRLSRSYDDFFRAHDKPQDCLWCRIYGTAYPWTGVFSFPMVGLIVYFGTRSPNYSYAEVVVLFGVLARGIILIYFLAEMRGLEKAVILLRREEDEKSL
jgi:hypothetical protein